MGLVIVVHGLSCSAACGISWTRDQICVPCIGKWILIQCTTREVPVYLLLVTLGLPCCRWALVRASGGCSSLWCTGFSCGGFSLWWFLLLWSTGSRHMGFSSCSKCAQKLWCTGLVSHSMWNLPRLGIKPTSPALAGRFSSTVPSGKSRVGCVRFFWFLEVRWDWIATVQSIVFVCFTVVGVLPVINRMLWSEKMLDIISVFLVYWGLIYGPRCDQCWRMFHMCLKKVYSAAFTWNAL